MCLTIDKEKTERFKKRNKTGKVTVYKAFDIKLKNIYSPIRGTKANTGFFKARGKIKKDAETINGGAIHAWKDRKSAHDDFFYDDQLVKCWAYRKDLIAIGINGDMAFTKIFVPKQEVEKTRSGK